MAEAFAAFIAEGDAADFEAFCAAQDADLQGPLRSAYAIWCLIRERPSALGWGPAGPRRTDSDGRVAEDATGSHHALRGSGFSPSPWADTLRRLADRSKGAGRYHGARKLASGGMGTIYRVVDRDLHRDVAMKVLEHRDRAGPARDRIVGRFLEEAQVTSQLEHPGIIPVHELGLGADGELYYTMRLVEGRDLSDVLARLREGDAEWTVTRVLNVLLRVCEAMAFAHSKGVIHRDLKPSNVMVGRFGETYVVDWGLARVLGHAGGIDAGSRLRVVSSVAPAEGCEAGAGGAAAAAGAVGSGGPGGDDEAGRRRIERDSPLVTASGEVVGTVMYMSPEQALGELDRLGPWTDVYAVGAILYELLTGRIPYIEPGERPTQGAVLERVRAGPPAPVHRLARGVPAELVAICEKAMARRIDARYPEMRAMAEDLRAYLENRVVTAHRTGAVVELRKWIRRNRAVAASIAVLIVALVGSGGCVAAVERSRSRVALRHLDEERVDVLLQQLDELRPASPEHIGSIDRWLAEAGERVTRRPRYAAELSALIDAADGLPRRTRDGAGAARQELRNERGYRAGLQAERDRMAKDGLDADDPSGPGGLERSLAILDLEIATLDERIVAKEARLGAARTWTLHDTERERELARLEQLVSGLDELADTGVPALRRRCEQLAAFGGHVEEWERATASIADLDECPAYGALRIAPQRGLVPLGRDARSGLWEFWHAASGERPERGDDGRLRMRPETGLVFVLVPGGVAHVGGQSADAGAPNYFAPEPDIDLTTPRHYEFAVHAVRLDPYFLSKYEMTQAQWLRLTGDSPSEFAAGHRVKDAPRISRVHPVEHVSWEDCQRVLPRWGLCLPTEAQWEHAARGGTGGAYWTGRRHESLAGRVNLADASLGKRFYARPVWSGVDDGWSLHAPVDAMDPNPFGLHHVLGNVFEWCRDWYADTEVDYDVAPGDGEHLPRFALKRGYRGGSFKSLPRELVVFTRSGRSPQGRDDDAGLRPARALEEPGRGEER